MSTPIPSLGNRTPEQLKVAELREELKKRGITPKGLKKDLVERLEEVVRDEVTEAAPDHYSEKPVSKDGPAVDAVDVSATFYAGAGGVGVPIEFQPEPIIETAPMVEQEHVVQETPVADYIPVVEPIEAADVLPPANLLPQAEEPVRQGDPAIHSAFLEEALSKDGEDYSGNVSDGKVAAALGVAEPVGETVLEADAEGIEVAGQDVENSSAVITDDVKAFNEDANTDSGDYRSDPTVISGIPDKIKAGRINTAVEEETVVQEADNQAEQLKPFRFSGPASSTDAVIMEVSEPEEIRSEKAAASNKESPVVYANKEDMEEGEDSVGEETTTEPLTEAAPDTTVVETVVTETVVTTETGVETKPEGDLSVAGIEGRSSETRLSFDIEEKEKEEKDEETEGIEELPISEDAKAMQVDSESLIGSKRRDEEESRHQEPTKRQRRWSSEKSGGATADVNSPKVITTDTLKDMIPSEARESMVSTTASPAPRASVSAALEKSASSRSPLSRPDVSANGEVDKKRTVPPPTRSPTVSLKIDRFVRPFTIKAVRELLEQTGEVKAMWMDQIKTHCFVTYSSVEEANATRNAVYNLQWPAAGGKLLIAEFVEPEEVTARVEGLHDKPAATPVTTPRGVANSASGPAGSSAGVSPGVTSLSTSALPPTQAPPSISRERPALPPKKEVEPPIPTLDDLFKKTRVKPQIYFLPLTEEQVANKLRNKKPSSKPPTRA